MRALASSETLPPVLVLALAVFTRLPGLDGPLWHDEVIMLVRSVRLPFGELAASYPGSIHQPLYALLAKLSVSALGESPLGLRLPAFLFGLLAVGSSMLLARALGSKREAVVVGLLVALSYHAVWYSQNARAYTGLMFFMTAASLLFYLGWHGDRRVWPWYALAVGLGAYLHPFMITVPVSHAALMMAARVGRRWLPIEPAAGAHRPAWLALAGGGVLTALLYAPAFPQMMDYYSTILLDAEPTADPLALVQAPIAALRANPLRALATYLIGALALAGLVAYGRRDPLGMAVLVLPGVLGLLVALVALRGVAPQFFVCLVPVAVIVVVRSVALGFGKWRNVAFGGLVAVSLVSLLPVYQYPKQDFPGALAYVRERAGSDASIAGFGLAGPVYVLYYAPDLACIYTQEEYDRLLSPKRETWILMTFTQDARSRMDTIYGQMLRDFSLVATFPGTVDDGDLLVYRRGA